MTCPACGERLAVQKWYDDDWMVEERRVCRCGYVWHWSYGNLIEEGEDDESLES